MVANPSSKMPITLSARFEYTVPIALNDYNAKASLYSEGVFIGKITLCLCTLGEYINVSK